MARYPQLAEGNFVITDSNGRMSLTKEGQDVIL